MSPRRPSAQQHGVTRLLMVLPLSCDPRADRSLAAGPSSFQVFRDRTDTRRNDTHTRENRPMYDMSPDWGPASPHPDNPRSHENVQAAVQASLDLRDNGGQRPDDN